MTPVTPEPPGATPPPVVTTTTPSRSRRYNERLERELEITLETAHRTVAELEKLVASTRSAVEAARVADAQGDYLHALELDRIALVKLLDELGYTVVDSGEDHPTGRVWADVDAPATADLLGARLPLDRPLAIAGVRLERLRYTRVGWHPKAAA